MKAIILARVSTEEQMDGHSIPAQLARAREYCNRKKFQIKSEHNFEESSLKDHRDKFLKVLEEIEKSKEIVALIAETVDRLQRSFKESVVLDELRKKRKVELHFIRENLIINENSNSSEIQRWDLAVFLAKSYVLQISDNVKRSIKQKINNGELSGKAPIGYINAKDEMTDKRIVVVDKERSHIVKEMFHLYYSGLKSVRQLTKFAKTRKLTTIGHKGVIKPISNSQIHVMLQNPFYMGLMKTKYGLFPHKYPPLITKEMFDRCQDILHGKGKKYIKNDVEPSIFRALIKCPVCGGNMAIDIHKDKKDKTKYRYVYLYCNNSKPSVGKCTNTERVEEKVVLEQIKRVFRNIQISDKIVKKTEEHLRSINDSKKDFNTISIEILNKEYVLYQSRIDGLIDLKLDKSITPDEYIRKMNAFKQKQMDITEELKNHTVGDENFNKTLLNVLELARNAERLFEVSELEEKRQLIKFITPKLILKEKSLHFTYRKPFDIIAKGYSCPKWLLG